MASERRRRAAACTACDHVGSGDGPCAGHALGQNVRTARRASESGRERPPPDGRGPCVRPRSAPGGGSLTPRLPPALCVGRAWRAAQNAAPGCERRSRASRTLTLATYAGAPRAIASARRGRRSARLHTGGGREPPAPPFTSGFTPDAASSCRADQGGEMKIRVRQDIALDAARCLAASASASTGDGGASRTRAPVAAAKRDRATRNRRRANARPARADSARPRAQTASSRAGAPAGVPRSTSAVHRDGRPQRASRAPAGRRPRRRSCAAPDAAGRAGGVATTAARGAARHADGGRPGSPTGRRA